MAKHEEYNLKFVKIQPPIPATASLQLVARQPTQENPFHQFLERYGHLQSFWHYCTSILLA